MHNQIYTRLRYYFYVLSPFLLLFWFEIHWSAFKAKLHFHPIIIIVTFAYSYRDEWKLVPFTRGSDLFSDATETILRRKRVKHGCCLIRGSGWIQRVRRFYWVRFTLDLGWTDTCNHVSSGKNIASFRMLAQCREQGSKEKEMIIIIAR